jgi:hypothetical protein
MINGLALIGKKEKTLFLDFDRTRSELDMCGETLTLKMIELTESPGDTSLKRTISRTNREESDLSH